MKPERHSRTLLPSLLDAAILLDLHSLRSRVSGTRAGLFDDCRYRLLSLLSGPMETIQLEC